MKSSEELKLRVETRREMINQGNSLKLSKKQKLR